MPHGPDIRGPDLYGPEGLDANSLRGLPGALIYVDGSFDIYEDVAATDPCENADPVEAILERVAGRKFTTTATKPTWSEGPPGAIEFTGAASQTALHTLNGSLTATTTHHLFFWFDADGSVGNDFLVRSSNNDLIVYYDRLGLVQIFDVSNTLRSSGQAPITGVQLLEVTLDGTGPPVDAQNETLYDATPATEGTFSPGTGHAVSDVVTLDDGTAATVDAVDGGGGVTQFTVASGSSSGGHGIGAVLSQASSTGSGTGFSLTLGALNVAGTGQFYRDGVALGSAFTYRPSELGGANLEIGAGGGVFDGRHRRFYWLDRISVGAEVLAIRAALTS